MKTLADFKRKLKIGVLLETENLYLKTNMGIRPISIVQSNSFALKTTKTEPITSEGMTKNHETGLNEWNKTTTKIVDSWCEYPKSKDFEIINENSCLIYWGEGDKREAVLKYTFK